MHRRLLGVRMLDPRMAIGRSDGSGMSEVGRIAEVGIPGVAMGDIVSIALAPDQMLGDQMLALTRMLRAGEIAGAGLDVYENGTDVNPRLRELNNVVLLPHMGSATVEGRLEMGEKVILNIKTFDDGHRPPDQVVPAML